MNTILKNIKTTFRQLFGFDEIEESKEWDEYLALLLREGYFSPEQIRTLEKSNRYIENLEEKLEETEENKKNRKKTSYPKQRGVAKLENTKAVEKTKKTILSSKDRE